jgi:PAS domain S-box-containing protein
MFPRFATQIRQQFPALLDQYDKQLRSVPGYASLPEPARRGLEQQVLQLMADCLDAGNDSALLQYIRERAELVLAQGFQPEWFQQAVTVAQEIVTPLVETVDEGNFVWRAMNRAQTTAWQIVARERTRIEQILRESELRYQTIFDATPVMFWLKDTHNRMLRINKAAAAFEGIQPEDVEGKSCYDTYPPEQAEAFYQDDLEVIRANQPKLGIVEQHTTIGTGKPMWIETGKTPVHNDQGEIVGVLAFGVDVTERQQAVEVARQSAEQQQRAARYLRATIEAANELTQAPDLDTLYRRTVELAREKFDVERCGLHLLDESLQYLSATYGTNDQRRTTDERGARRATRESEDRLIASTDQLWVVWENPHVFFKDEVEHVVGTGWVAGTVLRGAAGPIGILFNDNALSGQPIDEAQQESLAIYCSMLTNIIETKRLEWQIRQSLKRRSVQVQTSTEVAQEVAAATNLDELFHRVVTLIKERFDYYHAQIFRYDPGEEAAVLVSGYGEIGKTMLAAGHRLPMRRGVVGIAAATGESILATDVRQDEDWRPNPNLPETQGELAIPIQIGSSDAEAQLNALKYFIQGGFDGIALAAVDQVAAASLTHTALQQGKTIVAIGSDLGADNQTARVFAVDRDLGYLLGVQAGAWAKQHLSPGQTLRLGLLNERALAYVVERENGIIEGLKAVFGENIDVVANGSIRVAGRAIALAENWLREYPDLNMILSINDDGALGAYQAAQASGRTDPDLFFIGGIDAVPEALAAIQQGGIYQATVNQSPEVVGLMVVRTLVAAIKGRPVAPLQKVVCAPVNRSNVGDYLGPQRETAIFANQNIMPAEDLAGLDVSGLRLGLCVLTLANPFFAALATGARQEAERLGVHLSINDPRRVLGVLDVQSDRVGALTEDDRLLLEGLCGQIAIAIESTRLLESVRQSEELMRTLIDAIPDNIYAKDRAGRHILVNAALLRRVGFTRPEEMLGKTDMDLYPRELAEQYQASEKPLLEGQSLLGHEEPGVDPAGRPTWLVTTKVPLRDIGGRVTGIVGITSDITARKQVENDLRKFKLGLDRSTAAIFITDPAGVITYVNPAFEKIYGFTREEAVGQTPRIIKSGLIPQDQYQNFWGTLLAGQTVAGELINKAKDGRLVPIEGSNSAILDEAGNIIGFLALHNDITERKHTEEELARSAQLLNTIVNNSRDLIYIKNTKSEFLVASQALARLVGAKSGAELIGKTDFDFFPREMANKFYTDEQHIMDVGEPLIDLEEPAVYHDGTPVWLLTTKIPYRAADGTPLGILGIGRDITERKRSEQQMEETLHETERLYAAVSGEGWKDFRQAGRLPQGYVYDRILLQPAEQLWEPEMEQAIAQRKTVATQTDARAVAVTPLSVRGAIIGAIGVYDNPDRPLQAEDLTLIEAVSEQVALALESARLFEQTQHDAERERTINRITGRIRNARSVDEVLTIATQELRQATQASRSVAEISPATDQRAQAGNGEGVKA